MHTSEDYREQFEVDAEDVIQTSGKFEREHISIPYFWDASLEGDCVTVWDGEQSIYFITIGQSDLDEFPDLKDRYGLALYETESGFVQAVWFESIKEYNAAFENPDEVI